MAKDLPYFKFFVSEWNDGDITLEDYEVQGLFINLCSYYWSNECDLLFNKAKKKFKDAPEDLWQNLLDNEIIKEVDGRLVITFLDEQNEERLSKRAIKVKGGKASAESRKLKKLEAEKKQESNTSSTETQQELNSCSTETQLLREEKRREEKKREEERENTALNFLYDNLPQQFDTFKMQNQRLVHNWKMMTESFNDKIDLEIAQNKIEFDVEQLMPRLKSFCRSWISNQGMKKAVKTNKRIF